MMQILSLFLATLSLTGLVLPLFRHSYWWLRVFDYPKLHISILSVISIALIVMSWGAFHSVTIISSFILLAGVVHNLPKILKYTPLTQVNARKCIQSENTTCFRILQCNIRMQNRQIGKVKELIRREKPDIFLIVEADRWWADRLEEFDKSYHYFLKAPQSNTYGMILYSRLELKNSEINYLVKGDIPSFYTTVVMNDGEEFNLYCLHPEPPRPGSDTYERDAELLIVGRKIRHEGKPAIVVGDLNDVAWSYTSELFQRYSNLLDPREGRGFFNTYNAKIPFFRYPLDHFFYSEEFGLLELRKLERIGSDHFPMIAELCLESRIDHSQNQEQADSEDKGEVETKIEEGKNKT